MVTLSIALGLWHRRLLRQEHVVKEMSPLMVVKKQKERKEP